MCSELFNDDQIRTNRLHKLHQGISFRNLAKLGDEVGRDYDLEFLQKLIDVADMDNDGRVAAQEFWVYMKNFAELDRIRAEEKRKAIEVAKAKRVVRACVRACMHAYACVSSLCCVWLVSLSRPLSRCARRVCTDR